MKSIAWVNVQPPTDHEEIDFDSEYSLSDYDIVIFRPVLPYYGRIQFSGGGSCVDIEGTRSWIKATTHWKRELSSALSAGKTLFVLLDEYKEDRAATRSTSKSKGSIDYSTSTIDSYASLPFGLNIRNAKGRRVILKNNLFRGLYDVINEMFNYKIVIEQADALQTVFTARDGAVIGGVMGVKNLKGAVVLLPFFDFEIVKDEALVDEEVLQKYRALIGHLVAVDRMLKSGAATTPEPEWLIDFKKPNAVNDIDRELAEIGSKIKELQLSKDEKLAAKEQILSYSRLLYGTGKELEGAIEKSLKLLGYTVKTLRIGDLEIDHVIVGPSGIRMIGESEGKDTSAIDISKFRQLESNIGEDFERDEVQVPAKGILFGNGFRLSPPKDRAEQFTQKSLTNAKRLGSALIRTGDLYKVAVHILDNPDDDTYKDKCREAIESTVGGIVNFPHPG